jgi:hypothetical protein
MKRTGSGSLCTAGPDALRLHGARSPIRGPRCDAQGAPSDHVPYVKPAKKVWAHVSRALTRDRSAVANDCRNLSNNVPAEATRVKDMLAAVALSEAVYRLVDNGPEAAAAHANEILATLPRSTLCVIQLQCSLETASHRYDVTRL